MTLISRALRPTFLGHSREFFVERVLGMVMMKRSRPRPAWMNGDPEGKDCDSSWLSQICEHTERLQPAPREGEEYDFASLYIDIKPSFWEELAFLYHVMSV